MVVVLGPDGKPAKAIHKPVSYPFVSGGVSHVGYLERSHQLKGNVTPLRLASILREAEWGDTTDYLELAEDIEEQDAHYLGVLTSRKRQVAELEVTVEVGGEEKQDKTAADLVTEWLDRESLQDELFHLLDAIGKGYSCLEIEWKLDSTRWWPEQLA